MSDYPFTTHPFNTAAAPGTDLSASDGRAVSVTGVALIPGSQGTIAVNAGATLADGVLVRCPVGPSEQAIVAVAGEVEMVVGAGVAFNPAVPCLVGVDALGAATPLTVFPPAAAVFVIGRPSYQNGQARTAGQRINVILNPHLMSA